MSETVASERAPRTAEPPPPGPSAISEGRTAVQLAEEEEMLLAELQRRLALTAPNRSTQQLKPTFSAYQPAPGSSSYNLEQCLAAAEAAAPPALSAYQPAPGPALHNLKQYLAAGEAAAPALPNAPAWPAAGPLPERLALGERGGANADRPAASADPDERYAELLQQCEAEIARPARRRAEAAWAQPAGRAERPEPPAGATSASSVARAKASSPKRPASAPAAAQPAQRAVSWVDIEAEAEAEAGGGRSEGGSPSSTSSARLGAMRRQMGALKRRARVT